MCVFCSFFARLPFSWWFLFLFLSVQNECTPRNTINDRSVYELCTDHRFTVRPARRPLDSTWCCTALSAGQLMVDSLLDSIRCCLHLDTREVSIAFRINRTPSLACSVCTRTSWMGLATVYNHLKYQKSNSYSSVPHIRNIDLRNTDPDLKNNTSFYKKLDRSEKGLFLIQKLYIN